MGPPIEPANDKPVLPYGQPPKSRWREPKKFLLQAVAIWLALISAFAMYGWLRSSDPGFAPEIGPFAAFIFFGGIFTVGYFAFVLLIVFLLAWSD